MPNQEQERQKKAQADIRELKKAGTLTVENTTYGTLSLMFDQHQNIQINDSTGAILFTGNDLAAINFLAAAYIL